MAEFQVHSAAEICGLEHRTAPVGSRDLHQYGLRAEFRMAPDPGGSIPPRHDGVVAVPGLHFDFGGFRQVSQVDTTLDLALDDVAVDLVAQVLMRPEHPDSIVASTIRLRVTHPSVRDLFQTLGRQEAFQHLVSAVLRHESGPFSLAGLTPTAKA